MNRRHFLGGAFSVIGAGAVSVMSPALADTPVAPSVPDCILPPELLDRTEILIREVRAQLNSAHLLNVPADIASFYEAVVAQYESTFGEGVNWDELDDAALVLNDPNCFVADAPDEGCDFYEAWKFFLHHEGLALFPSDGSIAFRSLPADAQLRVVDATTAYVGMLQNLFSSLMTEKGMNNDGFNAMTSDLFVYGNSMNEIRLQAVACGVPLLPVPKNPMEVAPLMAQPVPIV